MADYYTFRVQITNQTTVLSEMLDLNKRSLGKPGGHFRYGQYRGEIQSLSEKASEGSLSEAEVKWLGEALFQVLFDAEVRTEFLRFAHKVEREKKLLRVELDIDERTMADVAAWPWEFLRVPTSVNQMTMWLGTAPKIVFSRYRAQSRPAAPIRIGAHEKLRIALVVSTPSDLGAVAHEPVVASLEKLAQKFPEQIELLPILHEATPDAIDGLLEREPHIFHFIGHGRRQNEGMLALVDDMLDEAIWVGAERFSDLFARHRPGVVLLQACEGGALTAGQAFVGVASRLVQQNIPVVVAMQYAVSNAVASRFALEFYRRLGQGDSVDKAAQEGRRKISLSNMGYKSRDFATPVLFMRVDDGQLFEIEKQAEASPVPVENGSEQSTAEAGSVNNVLEKRIDFGTRFRFSEGIPGDVMRALRQVLVACGPFGSNEAVRQAFTDTRIRMWQASIPEASSVSGRVDGVIAFLHSRGTINGENGLMLLLDVLTDKVNPGDGCYAQLTDLADVLENSGKKLDEMALMREMTGNFSDEDVRDLCFRMGLDYDDIGGGGRRGKIRELIKKLGYDQRLPALVKSCQAMKPRGNWGQFL